MQKTKQQQQRNIEILGMLKGYFLSHSGMFHIFLVQSFL